jgi:hypothetical protein
VQRAALSTTDAAMTLDEAPLPLLASVRCLVRHEPAIAGLPHVVERVNSFVDRRQVVDLPQACAMGSVALLQFVSRWEQLCPIEWAKDEPLFRAWQFSNGCVAAAQRGDLEVLKWLVSEYDTDTRVTSAVEEAARLGHLHILQWLRENCSERVCWNGLALRSAVGGNHLETARWLYEQTSPPKMRRLLELAAKFGNMDMIRWLSTFQGTVTTTAIAVAAENGHLSALKFMVQRRMDTWR